MTSAASRSRFALNDRQSKIKNGKSKIAPTRRRPLFESLENRSLLAGFNFADFSDSGTLNLVGDAAVTADNRLRLTPAIGGRNGAAWLDSEKQFVAGSFSTTFQFQLANFEGSPGAASGQGGSDGFVFAIQNASPTYLAGGGGTLGYHNLPSSLVVEFDTFQNSEASDPSGSHISVHTNGTGPNSWLESLSLGSYNTNPLLDDANVYTAKITYTPGTLSIYLDNLTTPKLTVAVDLAYKLALTDGTAWLGFTGATGGGWQTHDILNWSFEATIPSTQLSVSDTAQAEGNSGASSFVFNVTRSGDLSGETTVNWATVNGTAIAPSDYAAASGQLTFGPNESTKTISVSVNGDTLIEQHEIFTVKLSGATGGSIVDSIGLGTILNEETSISISDATANEGSQTLKIIDRFVSDNSGGLARPRSNLFGPDVNADGTRDLLVVSTDTNEVLQYDGATGAFLNVFVASGSGGLLNPADIIFGPNGDFYVSSIGATPAQIGSGSILRYDGVTGEFLEVVATGLNAPLGMTFHDDGRLLVANQLTDEVIQIAGGVASPFVPAGSGGLDEPRNVLFGPDVTGDGNRDLYVSSQRSGYVIRYNGVTGAFLDQFVSPGLGLGPQWMALGPEGDLYTVSWTTSTCCKMTFTRFDARTGAKLDSFEANRDGWSFSFGPDGLLYQSGNGGGNYVDRIGRSSVAAFTVTLSEPTLNPISVSYESVSGSALAGVDYVAGTGAITFAPGQTSRTILVQTLDDPTYEGTEAFTVNLSNPVGAVILDGQGVGTILDNDPQPTKFYVVDDASANKTFEYGSTGSAVENYNLNSGNTTPRGAASTAAGDKVWVVDANKNVYVYNTSGGLLGSWTAGSLPNNANVQGITTNGTDVWIVDSQGDKVYRYTGAATRLSGSQNAASNFALNTSNKDASDLVTDGTSIWVLNNTSSTDKVFKYMVSGTLQGSWTISSGGGSPTGLTIDPSAASASIWIVDSSSDRVYEFTSARSRTSGSQSPAGNFVLAAGNGNPQGIADPPVPSLEVASPAAVSRSTATSTSATSAENDAALLMWLTDDLLTTNRRK